MGVLTFIAASLQSCLCRSHIHSNSNVSSSKLGDTTTDLTLDNLPKQPPLAPPIITLATLPIEILQQIFSNIPPLQVQKYTQLCHKIHNILTTRPFALDNLRATTTLYQSKQFRKQNIIQESKRLSHHDRAWFIWPETYQQAYADILLQRYSKIEWGFERIAGIIPRSIGSLTPLTSLFLHDNHLHGPIPKQMGLLINLRQLYLNDNSLSGEIPEEIGDLVMLERLGLFRNCLEGRIPARIGELTNLQYLDCSSNQLSHCYSGRNLQVLDLSFNQISGAVPEGFGRLSGTLICLCLHRNCLQGKIPMDLFLLQANRAFVCI
ncbi:hypothetical protein BDR26DRAFT_864463 [Obelidium mucronatum]|nr:hypothetical protein BDR26DRAFT_864463 [Obelidium mucronatum]